MRRLKQVGLEARETKASWSSARNLAALGPNYAALGHRRLVCTNTVSVLEPDLIARAMGGTPKIIAVLLTADDATAQQRRGPR